MLHWFSFTHFFYGITCRYGYVMKLKTKKQMKINVGSFFGWSTWNANSFPSFHFWIRFCHLMCDEFVFGFIFSQENVFYRISTYGSTKKSHICFSNWNQQKILKTTTYRHMEPMKNEQDWHIRKNTAKQKKWCTWWIFVKYGCNPARVFFLHVKSINEATNFFLQKKKRSQKSSKRLSNIKFQLICKMVVIWCDSPTKMLKMDLKRNNARRVKSIAKKRDPISNKPSFDRTQSTEWNKNKTIKKHY